jgi:GT2 family glycosyltransferase
MRQINKTYDKHSETPTFTLIFLTWNSEDYIERTLESVLLQDYEDYELLVIDNDSNDGTIELIKDSYLPSDKLRIVRNDKNLGFTKGINKGVKLSRGKYICCYNDDTSFPPDYLSTLYSYVDRNSVWTTARINHRVSTENKCIRLLDRWGFPVPYNVDDCSGTMNVNYIPGDGIIIPRDVYELLDREFLFDPTMIDKGEDVELSLRLQSHDVKLRAILDTYSMHPDKGFYSLKLTNLLKHLQNVVARYEAYRANGANFLTKLKIIISALVVPVIILGPNFPRSTSRFKEKSTKFE